MSETEVKDNVRLQLAELELLSSMYPRSDEFRIVNPSAVGEFQEFLEGKATSVLSWLDLRFAVCITEGKIDVDIHLPHGYPSLVPLEVSARSTSLNREAHSCLNANLSQFILEQPLGCLAVSSALEWLQNNFSKYCTKKQREPPRASISESKTFSRLWIVSHHIYNKTKRRTILECGRNGNISGFCMPGKPGIICFEGPLESCADAWSKIKSLTWQKIGLKHREDHTLQCGECIDSLRKFGEFSEIGFQTKQNPSRDYHMDMGEFVKFLQEHDCHHVFELLFGIEGKAR